MVRNFLLVARLASSLSSSSSSTRYKSTHFLLGSLLQHKHTAPLSLFFNSFTSGTSCDSESDGNHHKGDTFTVSYLINPCGVSPRKARELSQRVNLKNPDGPNAVIDLLNRYGFSKPYIAKLVRKHPLVLLADANNTLLPKLNFLRSIGVSNADMPKILIANHHILFRSLEKCLIPCYEILRSVVCDDGEVVRALKNAPHSFTYDDMINHLIPNIKVLRQSSVPQASITLLVVHFPSEAYTEHSKFVEAVNTAKEIGCDPSKITFIQAIHLLNITSKTTWDSKFDVYESWGWSHEMTLRAFGKFPNFMMLSKETYTRKMSFLVKDMGLSPKDIAGYPPVLAYSLEERIIPRFSVIKILRSKGLLKKDLHFSSFMCITERNFLRKFVIQFQDDLPFLSDVYRGFFNRENVI